MDTNFFGALWITQAALPFLRAQGGGHILQVSSVGGLVAGSSLGVYHASKWALEGMSTSVAAEVARWGVKVTIVEPTGYSTDAEGSSAGPRHIPTMTGCSRCGPSAARSSRAARATRARPRR